MVRIVPGVDQRELASLHETFDAAVILWQSFGYFAPPTNDQILADIARLLRPGGRLLLDLYHPGFVRANVGVQSDVRATDCCSITNVIERDRLISTINYRDGSTDEMDFELFEPDDLTHRVGNYGFTLIEACSWWDSERPPSPTEQRYQLILERSIS